MIDLNHFQGLNQFFSFPPSSYFCRGEMAERSNAAVLKTVDCNRSGGSNPSLSALLRKWSEFVGNDFCETLIIKLNSQKFT
jgi:hypothetical protein